LLHSKEKKYLINQELLQIEVINYFTSVFKKEEYIVLFRAIHKNFKNNNIEFEIQTIANDQ